MAFTVESGFLISLFIQQFRAQNDLVVWDLSEPELVKQLFSIKERKQFIRTLVPVFTAAV